MPEPATVHATCVAIGDHGVLLRGPPGSGKSSLALCLMDAPGRGISGTLKAARLVADDRVILHRAEHHVVATAPATLRGKLEIRGLGIVDVEPQEQAIIRLVVDIAPEREIERLPEPDTLQVALMGVAIPAIRIDAGNPVATARIRAAFDHLMGG